MRVLKLKDSWCPHIIFEIIHVCINVHHVVSLSSFLIPIHRIFVGTLLKCHGTFNMPMTNVIHQPRIVRNEWGQRWDFFKMWLYALKFYMVRLGACLDGMREFSDLGTSFSSSSPSSWFSFPLSSSSYSSWPNLSIHANKDQTQHTHLCSET